MSLRIKVFCIVGTVLLASFLVVNQALSYIISRDFAALEQQEIRKNTLRVADALQGRIDELAVKLSDWAQWDDTYAFMTNRNDAYIQSNLQNEALTLLRINAVVLADLEGEVVFQKQVWDGQAAAPSQAFLDHIRRDIAEQHINSEAAHEETVRLPEGVMAYAVQPITSSDGTASANGYIAFGYFFDQATLAEIARVTHLDVAAVYYDEHAMTGEMAHVWSRFSLEHPIYIEEPRDNYNIAGNIFFSDTYGQPTFFLRVLLDRTIYRHGQEISRLFTSVMIAVMAVFSVLLLFLLNRLVLRRLFALSQQVAAIGGMSDAGGEIVMRGKDEFSVLAGHINDMLRSLRITEMNRKDSEKRFRTIADSAPVMIWMSDINRQCIYVNKGWLDFTGRTLEEEVGQGWRQDVHPDDVVMSDRAYARAFAAQQPFSIEYRLKRRDGSYAWVLAHSVPRCTADGVFLGYVGSCVDITGRKAAEEKNKERMEEIEKINRLMVKRELKMIELKEQIKKLQRHGE